MEVSRFGRRNNMDIIYISIVFAFFILTLVLIKICDALGEQKKGDRL